MFLLYNINPLTVHLIIRIIRTLLALVPSQEGMMALCRNMCLPFGAQL
jgi:hypothetical protein